jgi:hypothetical protein
MEDVEAQYFTQLFSLLKTEKFTGNLQINFNCGGITNIQKIEHIKIKKEIPVLVVTI